MKMRWNAKLSFAAILITLLAAFSLLVACAGGSAAPSPTAAAKATASGSSSAPVDKSAAAKVEPASGTTTGFANPDLLVETKWLSDHLSDTGIRILDVRTADEYKAGHIKGAISLPIEETFNPVGPKQNVGPAEQIEKVLGDRGISGDVRVIVYDGGKDTKGPRMFWTLEYYGDAKVAVLNGGFKKWQKESLAVATEETKATAAKFSAKAQPSLLATKDDVLGGLNKPGYAVVDARSPEEYRGDDVRSTRGGHVPGAVNIDWRNLFTNDDAAVFKSPAELQNIYTAAGITKDKDVSAY